MGLSKTSKKKDEGDRNATGALPARVALAVVFRGEKILSTKVFLLNKKREANSLKAAGTNPQGCSVSRQREHEGG